MKPWLRKAVKWSVYPLFYLFCLFLFTYLTFPYDRLKDRIISEFAKSQSRGSDPPQRLEIDSIDSYWLSGIEVSGVRIITPPDPKAEAASRKVQSYGSKAAAKDEDEDEAAPPKPSVLSIDEAHARVELLSLLTGSVVVNFWASAFNGEVSGTIPVGSGDLEVDLENVELALVSPLKDTLGVPMSGRATGHLELSAQEEKFDKANGSFSLTVEDFAVGDGKTKIADLMALPKANLGTLEIEATAADGVLTIDKFEAHGDIEFIGDGRIAVREPWGTSNADVYVRFKFADSYRTKDDKTKALLGSPGDPMPPLLEADSKVKRAKRDDGFYGFYIHGALKRPRFDPSPTGTPTGAGPSRTATPPARSPLDRARPSIRTPTPTPSRGGGETDGETGAEEETAGD
jgi:type II secretion system protein N